MVYGFKIYFDSEFVAFLNVKMSSSKIRVAAARLCLIACHHTDGSPCFVVVSLRSELLSFSGFIWFFKAQKTQLLYDSIFFQDESYYS